MKRVIDVETSEEKRKKKANIDELMKQLTHGQLIYVQITSMVDLQECHGFGQQVRVGRSSEGYIGVINRDKNKPTFSVTKNGLVLFERDNFIAIDERSGRRMLYRCLDKEKGFLVADDELHMVNLVNVSDGKRFGEEMSVRHWLVDGFSFGELPYVIAVNVVLGSESAIKDGILYMAGPLRTHEVFTKLQIPAYDKLESMLHGKARELVMGLYNADGRSDVSERLKELEAYSSWLPKEINPKQGVTIDVPRFLSGLKEPSRQPAKAVSRSV